MSYLFLRSRFPSASSLAIWVALAVVLLAGCQRFHRTDTRPLEEAGISYRVTQQLRALGVTDAEVAELVKAKQAGASEQTCEELVRIAREKKLPFTAGDAVAGLRRVGMSDETILQLARLDQLGLWAGEAQAMRLAGISDAIILELARHRAQGHPTLSGASLAAWKNAGMSEVTLLELVRRGVTDDQVEAIVALRRRGWSDSEILRRYPAR